MVSFLHTGDLHLGLKFNNVAFPRERALERRRELWQTFERIVRYAKENKIDFLLIAGDLFEAKYFTIGDITRVRDTFANAGDINIIISAGNHDYKGSKSLYDRIEWTSNVTIFDGDKIQKKEFNELNTVIYGYSWDRIEIRENNIFYGLANDVDKERNNILLIHGDLSSTSSYLPLNLEELNSLNMDYIALGHIHKPQILSSNIAYCGSPEPLDFGELGVRGIALGNIENNNTRIEFLPFSKRVFYESEITINEAMGYPQIVKKIQDIEVGNKNVDFYRIKLNGYIQRTINIKDLVKDLKDDFYHIEILDNTLKDYDLQELKIGNEDNIIGQFIQAMEAKGLENPVVKDALYYGLEVLMRGE